MRLYLRLDDSIPSVSCHPSKCSECVRLPTSLIASPKPYNTGRYNRKRIIPMSEEINCFNHVMREIFQRLCSNLTNARFIFISGFQFKMRFNFIVLHKFHRNCSACLPARSFATLPECTYMNENEIWKILLNFMKEFKNILLHHHLTLPHFRSTI